MEATMLTSFQEGFGTPFAAFGRPILFTFSVSDGKCWEMTEVDEATARDCLQAANWDLPRAIEEYLPGDDGTRAPDFTGLKDRLGVITGV